MIYKWIEINLDLDIDIDISTDRWIDIGVYYTGSLPGVAQPLSHLTPASNPSQLLRGTVARVNQQCPGVQYGSFLKSGTPKWIVFNGTSH